MAHRATAPNSVANQSPPYAEVNLFASDAALREAVAREGAGWAAEDLLRLGDRLGSAEAFDLGRRASENPPRLRRFDDKGFPLDLIEYHPAYHEAMAHSIAAGLHCASWEARGENAGPRRGAQVARLAGLYMTTQSEPGHVCPITMTHAAVPALAAQPEIAASVMPKIVSRDYDSRFLPIAEKTGITLGMGMTERQGGTDVRTNTTRAEPVAARGSGAEYLLAGHKWFLSAPMSDAFLMLGQAPDGLSCFFVPRVLPDGSVNAIRLQRLKDKLGNRANASAEIDLENAHGWLIGEEGRGIPAIIEMVSQTRLDCAVASAGQMRLALALAGHHCRHRRVFGAALIEQPLMSTVLADMALDVEAATALAFRLARSFDLAGESEAEAAWRRLMTPVTKYWVCKMAPALGYEAMECLGGNGYVEEGPAARLYREMPLNAIWEGSGNVMCLDVLRVAGREPEIAAQVIDEIAGLSHDEARLRAPIERVRALLADPRGSEGQARRLVEDLARIAAAALLRTGAPEHVAEAFIADRLDGPGRHCYGAGRVQPRMGDILERGFACMAQRRGQA